MRGPAWDGVRQAVRRVLPALIVGVGLAGAQPAAAQFFGWGDGWAGGWGGGHWGGLRPSEVGRAIAEQGFRVISPLRRNGSVFVADVVDRRGRRERLIVAAADAQILQRFYLDDSRLPGFVPRNRIARGSDESNWDNRSDVVPPASIPRSSRRQSFGATGDQDPSFDGTGRQDDGMGRQGDGFGQGDTSEPQRVRPLQKAPRSKPRLVDRTPDATTATPRDVPATARPQAKPSEATREPGGPAPVNERPADAAPKVANKPPESTPASPAPVATAPATRMRDPLAIPGGEPKVEATRPVPRPGNSAAVEPAPRNAAPAAAAATPAAKSATAPAKTGDVPVAPLD